MYFIPFEKLSKDDVSYFFDLDLGWFIPDVYNLEIIMVNNDVNNILKKTTFTIVSDGFLNNI